MKLRGNIGKIGFCLSVIPWAVVGADVACYHALAIDTDWSYVLLPWLWWLPLLAFVMSAVGILKDKPENSYGITGALVSALFCLTFLLLRLGPVVF